MKNLISIIFMGVITVMLTGCAFGKFEQSQENADIQVFKANDGYIQFTNKNQIKNTTTYVNGYRNTWGAIIRYGKDNGFTHFAIINNGINNLEGFPLNTFKSFEGYHNGGNSFGRNGKQYSFLDNNYFSFKVVYFKEKQNNIFLFNLKSVEQELIEKDKQKVIIKG